MFTGLVQAVGIVTKLERLGRGPDAPVRLSIDPGSWDHNPGPGDSISVSGVCLTVAKRPSAKARVWEFVAIPETLAKTTLGGLRVGSRVNLEHALTPSTLMGGHLVQGHVDGVGEVVSIRRGEDWRVRVRVPVGLREFVVPKGSVCLDGVSLTIAKMYEDGLEVALIPTTLEMTTLGALKQGDAVNIETDMVVKTIVTWAQRVGAVVRRMPGKGSGAVPRSGRSKGKAGARPAGRRR